MVLEVIQPVMHDNIIDNAMNRVKEKGNFIYDEDGVEYRPNYACNRQSRVLLEEAPYQYQPVQ